ncbi:MAG: phage/plasmid primase, P4 family [Candidatus Eisenbacteria bacterium]
MTSESARERETAPRIANAPQEEGGENDSARNTRIISASPPPTQEKLSAPADLVEVARRISDHLMADGGRRVGAELRFRCPAHDDEHPSADFNESKATWTCRVCGAGGGALDLAGRLNIPIPERRGGGNRSRIVAVYDYHDASGALVFQVVRKEPGKNGERKEFAQRRPDGSDPNGGWIWNMKGVVRLLYRLPNVLACPDAVVFVGEGEEVVRALEIVGLVATTNPGGAGKWRDDPRGRTMAEPLRGRRVVVLPDNDEPGRKHAGAVARTLHKIAADVRIVDLPGLPTKGDVVDWFANGGTADELRRLADSAPTWTPSTTATAAATEEKCAVATGADAERFTDCGNASRFVSQHGEDLRYCYPWRKWLAWDGKRWNPDAGGEVLRRAKLTARAIFREAADAGDDGEARRLGKHAEHSLADARLRAAIGLACCELPIQPEDLDCDPWALNVLNGTIDLRTGELRPYRREDLLSKLAPVEYDPTAEAPTWERFIREVMGGNENLVAYLSRAFGYAVTGDVREDALFFLHGCGCNGKSTLLSALRETLGPGYALEAAPDLLLVKRGETHPTERADLRGMRFVSTVEVEDGRRFAEVAVKSLTGRDPVRARRMREDFSEFLPTHKLFLAANHKPEIRGTDRAIWRRIHLVPFEVSFEGKEDRDLPEKLRRERAGILAWLVSGCLQWQRLGLAPPPEVLAAVESYRADMDTLGEFLAERCRVGPEFKASAADLYQTFKGWTDSTGEHAVSQRRFGLSLRERGFTRFRGTGGPMWWQGVGLQGE